MTGGAGTAAIDADEVAEFIATATGLSVTPSDAALDSALLRHRLGRPDGRFEPLLG